MLFFWGVGIWGAEGAEGADGADGSDCVLDGISWLVWKLSIFG